jgi:uncharacterized protein YjdB
MLSVLTAALLFAGLEVPRTSAAPDPEWPNLLQLDMDTGFDNGINPFTFSGQAASDGTTSIISINGNNAVEFRDASTSGNSQASSFNRVFLPGSALVNRINQVYNLPAGSPPVSFIFQFSVERTAESTNPVKGDISTSIEFGGFGDVTVNGTVYSVPRFPVPKSVLYYTDAYAHNEPAGSEVLEVVNDDDLATLRFSITPNGGSRRISSATIRFGARVESGATPEAFAVDDIGIYEVPEEPEGEPAVSISLPASSYQLEEGDSLALAVTAHYAGGPSQDVTASAQYASSNPAAATVSSMGTVTAVSAGSSMITAVYGPLSVQAEVTVLPKVQQNNLAGYWNFDQIDQSTVYDLSGNGNHGTVYNAVYESQGRKNGALRFNGVDSYVDMGTTPNINYSNGFTITLWVKPNAIKNSKWISQKSGTSTPGGFSLGFEANLARFHYEFVNASTPESFATYKEGAGVPGKWDHFAISWSPSSKLFALYKNGAQLGLSGDFVGPPTTEGFRLLVGKMAGSTTSVFSGLIDEVRIYDRELTSYEVTAVYNNLPDIPVTGIALQPTEGIVGVGSTEQLSAQITPWNAKNLNVAWSTGDSAVAVVDHKGLVTAVGEGSTVITATTADGNHKAYYNLTTHIVPVQGISLNKASTSLELGKTEKLTATIAPADATNKRVVWSSTNEQAAIVDQQGMVRAMGAGTAVITVTTEDGSYTASCTVTVTRRLVTQIALSQQQLALSSGASASLSVTFTPANATDKHLFWSSADPQVAVVNELGKVTATGPGSTLITAVSADGAYQDQCTVTVTNPYGGQWIRTFILRDYMNIYSFPEELVSYELVLPDGLERAHLKLVDAAGGLPVEYQLEEGEDGNGNSGTVRLYFRAALERNGLTAYVLLHDPAYTPGFGGHLTVTDNGNQTATVGSALQKARVPYGLTTYPGGIPLAQASAPLLAVARDNSQWLGNGSFEAPAGTVVNSVYGRPTREGPLFLEYTVDYELNNGRTYKVVLEFRHGEKYIAVDEYMDGISSADDIFFRFSYWNGLQPDGRLAMTNNGYNAAYSGKYNENVSGGGQLPYQLGLYAPNSGELLRATAFWKDDGNQALLFSIRRLEDWRQETFRIWDSKRDPSNLTFYSQVSNAYMRAELAGEERHWALSVIPREEMVITGITPNDAQIANPPLRTYPVSSVMNDYINLGNNQFGGGPEVKLFAKLTDFSLDRYKEMIFDFAEELSMYTRESNAISSYSGYYNQYMRQGVTQLANRFWDYSAYLGGAAWPRLQSTFYPAYGNSRWSWSDAERLNVRSILVFLGYVNALDTSMPHNSMLGGHPNFIMDGKQGMALAAGMFPEHPDAAYWKEEFMEFYAKWLDEYCRKANPALNASGGRWTENIATYALASLRPLHDAYYALKQYDGTDLYGDDAFLDWMEWMHNALVPTENGVRQLPPQGAHAADKDLGGGEFAGLLDEITAALRQGESARGVRLGQEWLWSLTKGSEGINPQLHSRLYTDYGAILRYDFGGEHEAYVNIQQLNGRGYRWSVNDNGKVYYAAKGQRFSWNDTETSGDQFDITKLSVFSVNNASLKEHISDGILYDFGYAQYYKALGKENEPYLSRGVMMIRDDYLAIYDDVASESVTGTFYWNNSGYRFNAALPPIYPVKEGSGDQLHVVGSSPLQVTGTSYGAQLAVSGGATGGEYVFLSDTQVQANEAGLAFSGKSGYAQEGKLAIFEGSSLALNGFGIARSGGEFGLSGEYVSDSHISGRLAGKAGGTVSVTLPASFGLSGLKVKVAGSEVPFVRSGSVVSFTVSVAQSEGIKAYAITSE